MSCAVDGRTVEVPAEACGVDTRGEGEHDCSTRRLVTNGHDRCGRKPASVASEQGDSSLKRQCFDEVELFEVAG